LSDDEWIDRLRERYGDRICFYDPQAGGNPRRTADDWKSRGVIGVYLKSELSAKDARETGRGIEVVHDNTGDQL
jgi:hypothetical protein